MSKDATGMVISFEEIIKDICEYKSGKLIENEKITNRRNNVYR